MTNSKDYLRQVGISEEQFSLLLKRLEQEIAKDLQNNKIKKRGVPSKVMTTTLNPRISRVSSNFYQFRCYVWNQRVVCK